MINRCLSWDLQTGFSRPLSLSGISWIAIQALKIGAVAAFTFALPPVSLLASVILYGTSRFIAYKKPSSLGAFWLNQQYHLYDKINLITLLCINQISLPLFLLMGSLSTYEWFHERKKATLLSPLSA